MCAAGLDTGTWLLQRGGYVGNLKYAVINHLGLGALGAGPHVEGPLLPALREELEFMIKGLYVSLELRDLKWALPINHLGVADGQEGAREAGRSRKAPH